MQDFSFNNQAFDYRLPNKLTSFYNQQENENCLNAAGSTNMFSNQKSSLSSQGDGIKQGSKLKVTAVKDPEYDISFSYIDNYNDEGPFTSNQTDAFEINTNYVVDMNGSEQQGPSNYRQLEVNKSNNRKETLKTCVDIKKYSCDVCNQSFVDESKLNIHKKSEHRTSPQKGHTTFDNFISNDPVNLSPMKNRVSDLNTTCKFVKPIEKISTSPLKPKKIYKCNVCNDSFTYQSACKRHEKLHVDLKPFSCDKCDKRFSRSFDLKNHIKMHNDLDKSKCSKCKVRVL